MNRNREPSGRRTERGRGRFSELPRRRRHRGREPRADALLALRCLFCHRSGRAVDALALRAGAIDLGRKTLANLAGVDLALASALLTPPVTRSPIPAARSITSVRIGACHARLPFAFAAKGRMISNFAHDSAQAPQKGERIWRDGDERCALRAYRYMGYHGMTCADNRSTRSIIRTHLTIYQTGALLFAWNDSFHISPWLPRHSL